MVNTNNKIIDSIFDKSLEIISNSKDLSDRISDSIDAILKSLQNNGKIIIFGNGGSAADAQHFAAEFIGRFEKERDAIPAIALTTDSSIITSLANDYSFDKIFERQCEALIQPNDIVFIISTSGNSSNVINGAKVAKKKNITSVGLLGSNGGNVKDHLTIPIVIPSNSTPRIQEVHRIILHAICQIVEDNISKTK
jgi:D-sedoheptulose 7-phosphate isomerase